MVGCVKEKLSKKKLHQKNPRGGRSAPPPPKQLGLTLKKSRIRETPTLLADADNSTDSTVGWTTNTQKPKKTKKKQKNYPKQKNSKMSRDMPKLAIYPLTRAL